MAQKKEALGGPILKVLGLELLLFFPRRNTPFFEWDFHWILERPYQSLQVFVLQTCHKEYTPRAELSVMQSAETGFEAFGIVPGVPRCGTNSLCSCSTEQSHLLNNSDAPLAAYTRV